MNFIFEFQGKEGCFKDQKDSKFTMKNLTFEEALDNVINYNSTRLKDNSQIVKRDDMIMKYNCSAHESGLALAYYAQIFRNEILKL